MTAETREVIAAALKLSREQQEYVVAVLSSALDDEDGDGDGDADAEGSLEEIEAAWLHETRQRIEEVRSGAVTPVPWSEAKQRLTNTQ